MDPMECAATVIYYGRAKADLYLLQGGGGGGSSEPSEPPLGTGMACEVSLYTQ